jgi:hypothetical protein
MSNRNLTLAAQVAAKLGITRSWPNVQMVKLAIENEAEFSQVSHAEAAEVIVRAGRELSDWQDPYSPTPEWKRREAFRLNTVDRFWFEDARWRVKQVYLEFRERREAA